MSRLDWGFLLLALMLIGGGAEPVSASDLSGAYLGANFGRAENRYDTGSIDSLIVSEAASAGDTATFTARSVRDLSDAWWVNAGTF